MARTEILGIVRIHERRVDPQPAEADVELRVGAAVQVLGCDDLVARSEQAGDRDELRGLAARYRQRSHAAFERGHAFFKHGRGGVHDARVDVPEALQVEQIRRVLGVFKDVGGGLIDRHRARAGFRIRTMPGVQRAGAEAEHAVF